MKKVLKANAKINLGLNILEKLPNGYHSLDMVMAPITLSDSLEIEYTNQKGNIQITSNKEDIPTDKENILYKVYEAFFEEANLEKEEIKIHLIKKIPHAAGLGGGSADGGIFLKELNEHYGNPLTLEKMIDFSKKIGADIPFFLINKTCRVKGIGEELEIVENNIEENIILIKPPFGVSAGEAYKNYSLLSNNKNANIKEILKGLKENIPFEVLNNMENHLEQGLLMTNNDIVGFKKQLNSLSVGNFFMSGSGSTFFTIIKKEESKRISNVLKETFKNYEIFVCNFL